MTEGESTVLRGVRFGRVDREDDADSGTSCCVVVSLLVSSISSSQSLMITTGCSLDGFDVDGFDVDGFDVDGFDVDGFDVDELSFGLGCES